jgi:hypothetical protein
LKKEIFQISKCLPTPRRKHFPATGKTQSDWWIFLAIPNKTNMAANAPINVMPDPREGGDTRGIDLISLLLGRAFYFI